MTGFFTNINDTYLDLLFLRRASQQFERLKENVNCRTFNFQSRVIRENQSKLIDDYAR